MKENFFLGSAITVSVLGLVGLVSLVACSGGGGNGGGEAAVGQRLFDANCALCHGRGGVGKLPLGKDLRQNEFIAALTDDQLVEFLKEGRRADHPLNEKGVDMPPKGGNPGLTDEDLLTIVAYLRSLS
jgi:mono/diheme cytochrome c family protein